MRNNLITKHGHCFGKYSKLNLSSTQVTLDVHLYFIHVIKFSQFFNISFKFFLFFLINNEPWNSVVVIEEPCDRVAQICISSLNLYKDVLLAMLVWVNVSADSSELLLDLRNRCVLADVQHRIKVYI
jgi:hypothetical protein